MLSFRHIHAGLKVFEHQLYNIDARQLYAPASYMPSTSMADREEPERKKHRRQQKSENETQFTQPASSAAQGAVSSTTGAASSAAFAPAFSAGAASGARTQLPEPLLALLDRSQTVPGVERRFHPDSSLCSSTLDDAEVDAIMEAWSRDEAYTSRSGMRYPLEVVAQNRDNWPDVVIKNARGKKLVDIPNGTLVAAETEPGKVNEFRIRCMVLRDTRGRVEYLTEPIQGYAKRWNFTEAWLTG